MNIPSLTNAQPRGENRRSASGQAQPAGTSFLEQLAQTSAGATRQTSAPDRSSFMKEAIFSDMSDFRTAVLDRMKKAKENEEEQEAWDKLMEYLDAWIESLREEADVRKLSRAHAALTALQTEAKSDRKGLGDYLLGQLESIIA